MAASSSQSGQYDVFIVHSSEDNKKAEYINKALKQKGLKTFAHYKEGNEFTPGKPVFDNIIYAVNCSRKVLILLTKKALESQWVSFEILMGLEKSHSKNAMCVHLVFVDVTAEERKGFMTGALRMIPSVELDFNKNDWVENLVENINSDVKMTELLPGGNVAHGLVFNHYIGYLVYVLPATEEKVKDSEYYSKGKFSKKYFILIPESCRVHPIKGKYGDILIERMPTPLDIESTHGDKPRKYNPVVYRVTKQGVNEVYYFTGDIPFILGTMSKMKEQGFCDIDLHLQSVRFGMTLQELVDHRSPHNKCKNKSNIIPYDDNKQSFAPMIWDALVQEFKEPVAMNPDEPSKVRQAKGKFQHADGVTAVITYHADFEYDKEAAHEVQEFLKTKDVTFGNGNGGSTRFSDMDKSRWKIFILSEEGIKDSVMASMFNAALEDSISNDLVQVLPVLAKGSDLSKLPYHFRWTTLLKQSEPDYVEKLWKAMQEEKRMSDFLPAGVLYEGLSYAFLINYMCFNLTHKSPSGKDFNARFQDAFTKYCKDSSCICVPKVFVLVPKSCIVPGHGSQFKREVHLGPIEPIVLGQRKYWLQFYQLTMANGKKVCYAREYATPAIALHDMANSIPFSGLDKHQMNEQARQFAEFSNTVMRNEQFNKVIGKVSEKCSILYFDDEGTKGKEAVIDVLEQELQKNITEGNVITK